MNICEKHKTPKVRERKGRNVMVCKECYREKRKAKALEKLTSRKCPVHGKRLVKAVTVPYWSPERGQYVTKGIYRCPVCDKGPANVRHTWTKRRDNNAGTGRRPRDRRLDSARVWLAESSYIHKKVVGKW